MYNNPEATGLMCDSEENDHEDDHENGDSEDGDYAVIDFDIKNSESMILSRPFQRVVPKHNSCRFRKFKTFPCCALMLCGLVQKTVGQYVKHT
jgi:hypothetical protein